MLRQLLIPSIALSLFFASFIFNGHSSEYTYDHQDSIVTFTLKHLGVITIEGRFRDFTGDFEFDSENIEDSVVSLVVQTSSLDTGHSLRDSQLRSKDYFWAEKFPEITFASRAFGNIEGNFFTIYGDLTIRGKTLPAKFETEFLSTEDEGSQPLRFRAETYIQRKDYGIGTGRWYDPIAYITGETLKISLEVRGHPKNAVGKIANNAQETRDESGTQAGN